MNDEPVQLNQHVIGISARLRDHLATVVETADSDGFYCLRLDHTPWFMHVRREEFRPLRPAPFAYSERPVPGIDYVEVPQETP